MIKPDDLATANDLTLPILGIPGLPLHIISLTVNMRAGEIITISCEFHPEQRTIEAMRNAWLPVLENYKLVRIDSPAERSVRDTLALVERYIQSGANLSARDTVNGLLLEHGKFDSDLRGMLSNLYRVLLHDSAIACKAYVGEIYKLLDTKGI